MMGNPFTDTSSDNIEEALQLQESLLKANEYGLGGVNRSTSLLTSINAFRNSAKRIGVYKHAEKETLRRVLDEIEIVSVKRMNEGLNEFNFTVGVFNCFFIAYMFGRHPEHLWLIYLIQGMYLIPRKFVTMCRAQPLNQALYYLDFCWCMNFSGFAVIGLLVINGLIGADDVVSSVAREAFFKAFLGVTCGALLGANIVLPFVAILFHDVNTMTGLFIHLMPPMVMYTFIWHAIEIREAWPHIFHLSYMEGMTYLPHDGPFFIPGSGLDSVLGNSIALYLLWWLPYVCFMLLIGIDLPKKFSFNGTPRTPHWDTVFHSTMRLGACIFIGKTFRGRSKAQSLKQMEENDFDLLDFGIYMLFHLSLAMASFYLIGYPCFLSQPFYLCTLLLVVWLSTARGAKRYTYYTTQMYSRALRSEFADVLDKDK